MVASASLNSRASKGTGTLSMSTMLPRCRSPWQRRTQPALPRSHNGSLARVRTRRRGGPATSACPYASAPDNCSTTGCHDARPVARLRDRTVLVIAGDHVGQRLSEVIGERALLLAMAEHGFLREAAHMHRPFDDLAAATELQATFVAHNRHQPKIDARCVRPIDLHLAHGSGVARMQRREIDEAQVHPLAQLVGILADEKDAGDVGFNDINVFAVRSVRSRIAQEGADFALLVVGEGEDRFQACAYLKAGRGSRKRKCPAAADRYYCAAGLGFAAAGELRLSPCRQDACLLDPVLALDAPLEVEEVADALDVGAGPIGNLLIVRDAERVQLLLDQHADAADALQVVDRRCRGATDAGCPRQRALRNGPNASSPCRPRGGLPRAKAPRRRRRAPVQRRRPKRLRLRYRRDGANNTSRRPSPTSCA